MSEIPRIIDQLNRCMDGPAWHGDSVMEILKGVTAEQAAARPIGNAHTIWEIVRHITVWQDVARKRIQGQPVNPTPEEDWPPITDTTETAWRKMLDALRESHTRLAEAIADLYDFNLDEARPGFETTPYVLLHGVVQHNLYHAGQLALLKKFSKQPR